MRVNKELLIAQYGSNGRADNNSPEQKIADLYCDNFNDPALITEAFHDMKKARAIIEEAAKPSGICLSEGGLVSESA